ncbi:hypothetical protein BGX33_009387 [Mortierella sp. NVP41]|nr:hypothetical protein BGX33_009387 [Mortierella sp. NVP41]
MDTKKRPNQDLLDSEANPSSSTTVSTTAITPSASAESTTALAAQAETGGDSSSAMEIDSAKTVLSEAVQPSPATHSAATMAAENMQPIESEATNKRVKLTMETDKTGSNFSPSIDLADPSQESKGLAEWVGKMDKDDQAEAYVAAANAPSTATETKADDSQPAVTDSTAAAAARSTDAIDKQDSAAEKEQTSGQDLVNALLAPAVEPSHAEVSGSILAVASLSEPMVAILESLDNQADTNTSVIAGASAVNLAANPEPSETATTADLASTTSDQTTIVATAETDEKDEDAPSNAVETTAQSNPQEQAPAPQEQQDVASDLEEGQLPTDQDVQMEEKADPPVDIPPVVSATKAYQINDATTATTAPPTDNNTTDSKKPISPTTAPNEVNNGIIAEVKAASPSAPKSQELPKPAPNTTSRDPSSPAYPDTSRPAPADVNHTVTKPPQPTSLPPLSSISGAPTLPVSQSTRPARSTMSVSALLLNNDDESEQEQDRGRRSAGNMFDPFGNSSGRNRSSSPPPILAPPPPPQHSSVPLPGPSIPPPRSLASVHAHSDHSGYGRGMPDPSQSSRRSQDFSSGPGGVARGSSSKDYPADEVMESGGVVGFSSQRHRLPSPIGARSHQEPLPGPGGPGGPVSTANSKLPGLGSVTGGAPPPPHSHDHHNRHRPMYRPEGAHPPPMGSGRPNSYSPNQHSTMTHSPPVNGHPHYAPNGPPHHPSGIASNAPLPPMPGMGLIVERHAPRLIVKNDPSLKMSNRPELFLGYYRYDPAILLPAMQGKENSLLEVRIASTYLTYDNVKVKKREVWGTDVYTDDSDVVAMLIHAGYFIPPTHSQCTDEDSLHPTSQMHNFVSNPIKHICPGFDLAVTLRVMPKLIRYQGSIRNRIKSRTWSSGHDGVSFRIESIRKLGAGEALNRGRSQSKRRMKEYSQERLRVLANIHDETTESLQNERAMRTATFEFTHQGDPCFKYSPELVMDRHDGLSRKWTSWRLKKEVLILENEEERYEISLQHQAGTDARRFDQYRFAVISPRTSLSSWSKASYPLDSADLTEVLYEDLDWQDFEWVERGVVIQPSQREKHGAATSNGNGSLMEGVEATQSTSKDDDVDMEDGEIHDGAKDSSLTTQSAASSHKAQDATEGGAEARQEGVFCVVSRLYWRPMSENGLTKRATTTTTKPAEVTNTLAKPTPVVVQQNGPSSRDSAIHSTTNLAVAVTQEKSSIMSVVPGVKPANSTYNTNSIGVTKPNQEQSVGTPVVQKETKDDNKEQEKQASVAVEPSTVQPPPPPPYQQQQQQQQQQPAPASEPTAAANTPVTGSTLEHTASKPAGGPATTKPSSVPAPAVAKDVEAMDVDSTVAPPAESTAVPVVPPPVPIQHPIEAIKPASVAQEPPKAVVVPEDDEREEGELEEGEIASD